MYLRDSHLSTFRNACEGYLKSAAKLQMYFSTKNQLRLFQSLTNLNFLTGDQPLRYFYFQNKLYFAHSN